mmetsp:Transcript_30993/g.81483  ORF Transcript_30993/g.81483 Transcript_30993/m.81483 type:complete len:146 (-) Transcript_30993:112-549(-)
MARMLAAPSRPGRAVTLLVVAACARTCALASREPHSALPDDALPDDAQLLQAPELLKMALMQTSFEVTFGRDRMLQQQRAERRGAAAPQAAAGSTGAARGGADAASWAAEALWDAWARLQDLARAAGGYVQDSPVLDWGWRTPQG